MGVSERIITGQAGVDEGAAWLAATCPGMARALEVTGPLPTRLREDGFEALVSVIVGQQVSVASARAGMMRLEGAGLVTPEGVRAGGEGALRAAGMTRQKARYIHAIATADLDFEALRARPSDEVIATLVALPGVGPWTAEIYAMFSLGRADVFAPGDLALQEAARMIYDMPARPTDRALRAFATRWSPWRSVAARVLWSYYEKVKSREGIA